MVEHSRKFNSRESTRNPIQRKGRPFVVHCSANNGPLLNRLGCSLCEESFEMAAMSYLKVNKRVANSSNLVNTHRAQ